VTNKDLEEYVSTLELSGITEKHLYNINLILKSYLKAVNYEIKKDTTIKYLKECKNKQSVSYYRKNLFQIKKLLESLKIDWAFSIKPPRDPVYKPIRVSDKDIEEALNYFEGHKSELRYKSVIMLGADSGLRIEEIYQLRPQDIDLDNKTVYVNHKPELNQTTKTRESRVSFFTESTKNVLSDYLEVFNKGVGYGHLFGQSDIQRAFRGCNIKVKMLRKYFSQKWTRNNGNYQVKEMLMGHSLKKSVDSQHYCNLTESELRNVYDKVMS
jgi:integrase